MFHEPEFYPNISMKLASVLEEIGVNERVILKRRRSVLLCETRSNISYRLKGLNTSRHFIGSQSEGTTTLGLNSDTDNLICHINSKGIQDWGEWDPGLGNTLMIQEETTPLGYCMLQKVYNDDPTPVTKIDLPVHAEQNVRYRGDKFLLKNTYMDKFLLDGRTKNGPAGTQQVDGCCYQDYIVAFPFKTIPKFLVLWLQQQTQQRKISQDMKRYIESNPCYVVPVGRKKQLL